MHEYDEYDQHEPSGEAQSDDDQDVRSNYDQDDQDYQDYQDDQDDQDVRTSGRAQPPVGRSQPSDDYTLEDGYADTERTSKADECGGLPIIISGNLSDLNKNINILTQDPLERFKRLVGAISHSIDGDGIHNIGIDDRNRMCSVASNLENVKYLNPTAYILGFISTNGGKSIDKKIINKVFNNLDKLKDESVKKPDVIRYARFWIGIKSNTS